MADFHFLRPLWLLLLILLPLIPFLLRHRNQGQSGWARIIPDALLRPLLGEAVEQQSRQRRPGLTLGALVIVCAIALAGPSWRQAPTPLMQQNDSLVIVLDLSLSMLAQDVDPDRLTQAKRKIRDILEQRKGSFTALVVYAGDAHVVTPLTDDGRTIESLLGVLDPFMMPASGNRADLGVERAETLLDQGAPGEGRVLLVADSVRPGDVQSIRESLQGTNYTLSTLVVGTREGSPIPLPKRGFIRDGDQVVIAKANPERLASLADATGGRSSAITLDDGDIRSLELRTEDSDDWHDSQRQLLVDRWQDDGYWLLWLAAPLALLAWRRGALLLIPLVLLPMLPQPAQAMDWNDLWTRPDQRGEALIAEDPSVAAGKFKDPQWKGSALYRSGYYGRAAEQFEQGDGADAHYNRGNALARKGELQAALDAYDTALMQNPDNADAQYNRDLVKKLLEQQQRQQEQRKQQNQQQQNQEGQGRQSQSGQGQQQQDSSQGNRSQSPGQQPDQAGQQGQPQGENGQQPSSESGDAASSDEQQAQDARQPSSPGQRPPGDGEQASASAREAEPEDRSQLSQSQEQWLRRIPDDPSGLMRRKFLYQYRKRGNQQQMEGDTPW
ncbi:vWA domain-containing protein [Marinobacter sp. JSM 1782161]|uniref:vWA domain-containing protein n=1 Tax=Marinobacter sp. JSM 1782161 TaxID=2685906 RepID=UPI0014031A90|nr:VWA domain-containing protein [Marinobacter sp. JSM 1782161]